MSDWGVEGVLVGRDMERWWDEGILRCVDDWMSTSSMRGLRGLLAGIVGVFDVLMLG